MGLVSPFTLIRAVSLFHLTAAYIFLTSPNMIADQNAVFMLGESLRLPHASSLDKPSDASAFVAVILAFLGIADLTAASLNEEASLEYWLSNVPVRLLFLFGLNAYIYLFKDDGLLGSKSLLRQATPGDLLRNSLIFSWAFLELAVWFWVFSSLRSERQEQLQKKMEKLKAEEDRL